MNELREPRVRKRWPTVANRHRKEAIEKAEAIIELIDNEFTEKLQDRVIDEIEEALLTLRTNPMKAVNHLKRVQLSLETISYSIKLIRSNAELIKKTMETAPASGEDNDDSSDNSDNSNMGA